MLVQLGELLLLIDAELSTLAAFHKAVECVRNKHLGVEGLILFQKSRKKVLFVFHLLYLCKELLRELSIFLAILDSARKVICLYIKFCQAFVMREQIFSYSFQIGVVMFVGVFYEF